MASQADVPLLMRQFNGVNIADAPVFIGPSYLQSANNWLPNLNFEIQKRKGEVLYQFLGPPGFHILALLRTYDNAGNRYLFAVATDLGLVTALFAGVNDGPLGIIGTPFTAPNASYGMTVLGQRLYVGNGVGFLRAYPLSTLAEEILGPLPMTDDTGQTVGPVADPTTLLDTGTYSYVWGVYDTATKQWVSIGSSTGTMVHTVTLSAIAGASQSLSFTAPTPALPPNQLYHLFVTFPDAPIESAHDQAPEGLVASASLVLRTIVFNSTPVPLAEVGRRGNILVPHRSAIWFAGDQQNPSRVFSTATVVPGLEQEIFDIGDFFPWNADEPIGEGDGDLITGLAVAALTSTQKSPESPMAILKQNSTWLFFGDLGDPNSELVQISGKVGCVAPATVVPTRWGVVFCGRDSVYLLPASLTEPLDIGWPIAPFILGVDPAVARISFAFYQNGFYHLVFPTPFGQSGRGVMWSFDMRRGPGAPRGQGPTPSWWGPHDVPSWGAATVGTRDPKVIDRTFLALTHGPYIVENDQPTETEVSPTDHVDPAPIVSVLKSAALDAGDAFGRKLFQRTRLRGRAQQTTDFDVCLFVDEMPVECRTGALPRGGGALWNFGLWNSALWGGLGQIAVASDVTTPLLSPSEGDGLVFGSGVPDDASFGRVWGYQAELVVTHREAVAVMLRDLELRYLPRERPIP